MIKIEELNEKQQEVVNQFNGAFLIQAAPASGKAIPCDTIIPTPSGDRRFGDLKVGDYVFSKEGKPTKVTAIYPQGLKTVYKVKLEDGRIAECCDEHLWTCIDNTNEKISVFPLKDMIKYYDKKNRKKDFCKYSLPMNKTVNYDLKSLPIAPYIFGCFLVGLGTKSQSLKIKTDNENVPELISLMLSNIYKINFDYKQDELNKNSWIITKDGEEVLRKTFLQPLINITTINPIYKKLKKFIPNIYKQSSIEQRTQLLAGILDTGSNIDIYGNVTFSTPCEKLAKDIRILCWSLGIKTSLKEYKRKKTKRTKNDNYNILFHIPYEEKEKFFLTSKKIILIKKYCKFIEKDTKKVKIQNITKSKAKKEMMCITVENEENLYLMNDYIVTHNTKTIINRIANMINNDISPTSILAITFTNKAASDLKEKIKELIGENGGLVQANTFHSFCARILRENGKVIGIKEDFKILNEYKSNKILLEAINRTKLNRWYSENIKNIKDITNPITRAKENLVDPKDFLKYNFTNTNIIRYVQKIYEQYQILMKELNSLDFNDLLFFGNKLLENKEILNFYQDKYKYILVDEYQDTDKAQYQLIKKLAYKTKNLCVVGDLNQMIYSWRNANIKNTEMLIKDFEDIQKIELKQNYRSTQHIVNAANTIIKNGVPLIKNEPMYTSRGIGDKIRIKECFNPIKEAEYITEEIKKLHKEKNVDFNKIAILYRLHNISAIVQSHLAKNGIPVAIKKGTTFFETAEISGVLGYLKFINGDEDGLLKVINIHKGIGSATIEKLNKVKFENNITLFEAFEKVYNKEISHNIQNYIVERFLPTIQCYYYLKDIYDKNNLVGLIKTIVEESNFVKQFKESNEQEERNKYENIFELYQNIISFCDNFKKENNREAKISDYLNEMSLSTLDDSETTDGVNMLTVHAAKGLEFDYVFIIGMEKNIFPMNVFTKDSIEEERRLFYVAITRARELLTISYCSFRRNNKKKKSINFSKIENNFNQDNEFTTPCFPSNYIQEINDNDKIYV